MTNPNIKDKVLLTISEACEITNIGEKAMRVILAKNRNLYIKLGTKYLIKRDRFLDYINDTDTLLESGEAANPLYTLV